MPQSSRDSAAWVCTLLLAMALVAGCDGNGNGNDHPVPVAEGLDARPSNTSCLAGARRVTNAVIDFEDAFPALTFNYPVGLYMEPDDPNDPNDDPAWFVVEQGGIVKRVTSAGVVSNYIDISARVTFNNVNSD